MAVEARENHTKFLGKQLKQPVFSLLVPILLFITYLCIGKYYIYFPFLIDENLVEHVIIFNIRLPRGIIALTFRACMGISSAALQTTLRNPLVSPYILGIASGEAFGAALSIA